MKKSLKARRYDQDEKIALLSEYKAIPRGGKVAWMRERHLSAQSLQRWRDAMSISGNAVKHNGNGNGNVVKRNGNGHAKHDETTLEQAILAMEIKRDAYTEVIAHLKAMQNA